MHSLSLCDLSLELFHLRGVFVDPVHELLLPTHGLFPSLLPEVLQLLAHIIDLVLQRSNLGLPTPLVRHLLILHLRHFSLELTDSLLESLGI